jgi:hypothetical protein
MKIEISLQHLQGSLIYNFIKVRQIVLELKYADIPYVHSLYVLRAKNV